jgi:hypothetical protein
VGDTLLYFAYGSNLHPLRLQRRTPSARLAGLAVLEGHVLRFHKRSDRDGSAKCDAWHTGRAGDRLLGAIYHLHPGEVETLDRFEGVGSGYLREVVEVLAAGEPRLAFTYRAQSSHVDPTVQPYDWYREYVLRGARYHGLPAAYVRRIETVEAIPDPDPERGRLELALALGLETFHP